jgi:threonine dehydratase
MDQITLVDVYAARDRLRGQVRHTPLQESDALSEAAGAPVYLKLEHQQITGSFKLRGATNAVAQLTAEQRARGVVGVSTGNHGRGLAFAARAAGVRAVVCMSELVPKNKVDAIAALGAEVRIAGKSQDDAEVEVQRLVAEEGMTLLSPFDHPHVIAGQGTLGLEMIEDLPGLDTVVVPLSGGGLLGGVALTLKTIEPTIRTIGVSMERGPAMVESLRAGKPVFVEEFPTLADSLGGGIGLDNRFTFSLIRDFVDETLLVSETQIAEAIQHAYRYERQIVEGGAAVGIAAMLAGLVENPGTTLVLLSGGNIDMQLHQRLINGEDVSL